MTRFSPEQLKKAGPEAHDLLAKAKEQLEDNKRWLERGLATAGRAGHIPESLAQELISDVEAVVLKLIRPEVGLQDLGRPTLTVAYDYPDRLYDFLLSAECPAEIKINLHGAILLDPQATTTVEVKK